MFGAMGAYAATKQRSVFLELATAEMETLRAAPYAETCVDPAVAGAYTTFEGGNAVFGTPCAVQPRSDRSATAETTAYTVRRWVTWTNPAGENVAAADATYKRLTVDLSWTEKETTPRTIRLTSVRYPGGFGPTGQPPGPNKPPVATASVRDAASGGPVFTVTPNQVLRFVGSDSTDDGGVGNLTYSWDFGDGTSGTGAVVPSKVDASGRIEPYPVRLTVTDVGGLSSEQLLEVQVVANVAANLYAPTLSVVATCNGDSTPVAATSTDPGCDPLLAVAPLGLTFTATSSDADDDDVYYTWDWKDGSPIEGGPSPVRSHVFATARRYDVEVRAYDLRGKSALVTRSVLARPLNCAVTSGSLYNGTRSVEQNVIWVKVNATPHSSTIELRATTPLAPA